MYKHQGEKDTYTGREGDRDTIRVGREIEILYGQGGRERYYTGREGEKDTDTWYKNTGREGYIELNEIYIEINERYIELMISNGNSVKLIVSHQFLSSDLESY